MTLDLGATEEAYPVSQLFGKGFGMGAGGVCVGGSALRKAGFAEKKLSCGGHEERFAGRKFLGGVEEMTI